MKHADTIFCLTPVQRKKEVNKHKHLDIGVVYCLLLYVIHIETVLRTELRPVIVCHEIYCITWLGFKVGVSDCKV